LMRKSNVSFCSTESRHLVEVGVQVLHENPL